MTAIPQPPRRRPWIPILVLVGIAIVGAAIGAYLDWRMWHPTSGIVVTIGAIGLLLIGALAWASHWQPIRPVAYGVLAFAIGAILGQNLGPSRPPISMVNGTITLELTEPADASPITGRADCQLTPDGDNFQVSGDPNLRLQLGDQPLEQRDPIQVALARGDMWEHGAESRGDGWSVLFIIGDAGPFTDEQVPTEVAMATDGSSELIGSGDQRAGSVTFAGLVEKDVGLGRGATDPVALSGTLSWTCDGPAADPER
jgi:hypothetical protein